MPLWFMDGKLYAQSGLIIIVVIVFIIIIISAA